MDIFWSLHHRADLATCAGMRLLAWYYLVLRYDIFRRATKILLPGETLFLCLQVHSTESRNMVEMLLDDPFEKFFLKRTQNMHSTFLPKCMKIGVEEAP